MLKRFWRWLRTKDEEPNYARVATSSSMGTSPMAPVVAAYHAPTHLPRAEEYVKKRKEEEDDSPSLLGTGIATLIESIPDDASSAPSDSSSSDSSFDSGFSGGDSGGGGGGSDF